MLFYESENIAKLNVELWLIPILLLLILLYATRKRKYKKIVVGISILYVLFMVYNLYYIFWNLINISGTLYYYLEYPYGFTFLFFTIFLIINIFLPNRISTIIASVILIVISFNQIYLRIVTDKMNIEYKSILENNGSGNVLTVNIDTINNNYSNFFAGAPGFLHSFEVYKNISFTPYFALKDEHFMNFKFPNYYWTKYSSRDRKLKATQIVGDFIPPKIIEKIKLKPKSKIDKFAVIYRIDKNGELISKVHIFPDTLIFINEQEYFNSIKIIPASLNGQAVESTYLKDYMQ